MRGLHRAHWIDLLQMELDKCLQSIACTGRQFAISIPTKYTLEWMFDLPLNPISASKWPLPQHIITWLCPSLVISATNATVQFHFQKKVASAGFHQDIFLAQIFKPSSKCWLHDGKTSCSQKCAQQQCSESHHTSHHSKKLVGKPVGSLESSTSDFMSDVGGSPF